MQSYDAGIKLGLVLEIMVSSLISHLHAQTTYSTRVYKSNCGGFVRVKRGLDSPLQEDNPPVQMQVCQKQLLSLCV